jgi:hypothetical protein
MNTKNYECLGTEPVTWALEEVIIFRCSRKFQSSGLDFGIN